MRVLSNADVEQVLTAQETMNDLEGAYRIGRLLLETGQPLLAREYFLKSTVSIEHLTEHLKINRKDHSSRRGLLKMVAQRRSLLDYLSKTKADRYKHLIEKLNLRK